MFCNKCGAELSDDDVFCEKCGNKVGGGDNPDVVDNIHTPVQYNPSVYNNYRQYGGGYNQNPYSQPQYPQNPYPNPYQNPYQNPYGQYPPPVQPTVVNNFNQVVQPKQNGWCTASFVVCIVGIFVGAVICGPLAFILGVVGLITFNEKEHNNKWMGIVGVALGVVDLILGIILASVISSFIAAILSEL
jgi:hypothetical protein